jgi:hypothetical protein
VGCAYRTTHKVKEVKEMKVWLDVSNATVEMSGPYVTLSKIAVVPDDAVTRGIAGVDLTKGLLSVLDHGAIAVEVPDA